MDSASKLKFILLVLIITTPLYFANASLCSDAASDQSKIAPAMNLEKVYSVIDPNSFWGSYELASEGTVAGDEIISIVSHPSVVRGTQTRISTVNPGYYVPDNFHKLFSPIYFKIDYFNLGLISPEKFYQTVYQRYSEAFNRHLINLLNKIDVSINFELTVYGEIRSLTDQIGTWRIVKAGKNHTLPYQRLNDSLKEKIPLSIDEKIEKALEQGIAFFEIGTLNIDSPKPEVNERAMRLVELNWLLELKDDAFYVAHTTTKVHTRRYRRYGFIPVESFDFPESSEKHSILLVRGAEFKKNLARILNVNIQQNAVGGESPDLHSVVRELFF